MPTFENRNYSGVVVLGCPRSGTTLLRRLLDSHPEISCPGETFLFKSAAKFLEADKISGDFDYGAVAALEALGYEETDILMRLRRFVVPFYEEIAARQNKRIWAAKTAVDSFYIPQIERLFAGHVKFIGVVRHGLDVACSMDEFSRDLHSYIEELHRYVARYPRPMEAFVRAWADVTTQILDFSDRHASGDCHLIRYEDLVSQPENELAKLETFLGVAPFGEAASALLNKNRRVDGIGDWKSYSKTAIDTASLERWREQIPDALLPVLAPIADPVLIRAGYDPVADGGSDEDARRRRELALMMMRAQQS